jgi:hypothetical protein
MAEEEIPTARLAWREALGNEPNQFFSELRSTEFSIRLINLATKEGRPFESRQYNVASVIRERESVMAEASL